MLKPTQRITVITRPTRLAGLLRRWGTKGQAEFRFRVNKVAAFQKAGNVTAAAKAQKQTEDADFNLLEDEDDAYQRSLKSILKDLDLGVPVQTIDRSLMPNYDFSMSAAVIVLGQDGLVANAAKYVGAAPIIGVNPDPASFDGVLLPFPVNEARSAAKSALDGNAKLKHVTLAEATLQDGQKLLAFNDLFIGVRSHVSARYTLKVGQTSEPQSSSGVLVCTGAGSTGWMSSVYNMAAGIAGKVARPKLAWDDRSLLWAVREPFASRTSKIGLVCGRVEKNERIEIESMTPENGVIFSDGIESDALEFNAGTLATIGIAKQTANLVVR